MELEHTAGIPDRLVFPHQHDGYLRCEPAERPGIGTDVDEVPYPAIGKLGLEDD